MRLSLFGAALVSMALTVSSPMSALAHSCKALFSSKRTVAESDYEKAVLKSYSGRNEESQLLIAELRERISTLPIVRVFSETQGSHGAYRAELSDGTQVLIKPHHDDWYSSIPKEVAASIYSSLIGLPLVPVAGHRIDPHSGLPASVHLYLPHWNETKIPDENQYLGSNMSVRYANHYGTEINFLLFVLDYSSYEIKPRHILEKNLTLPDSSPMKLRSLIDLGSAFLGRGDGFGIHGEADLLSFRLPPKVLSTIESLSYERFERELAPYMPAYDIRGLYNRTRDLAWMLKAIDPVTGELDKEKYQLMRKEFYSHYNKDDDHSYGVRQKWDWRHSLKPPQFAIDLRI